MNLPEILKALLAEGLSVRVRCDGFSMLPTFGRGVFLTIAPCPFVKAQVGDIVVYDQGELVAHRVFKKHGEEAQPYLLTRGDAYRSGEKAVFPQQVLGRVVGIEPNGILTFIKQLTKGAFFRRWLCLKKGNRMIYQKHSNMVARKILDEVILVPVCKNVANMQSIFTLNETGAFVWDRINGKNSEEDILKTLIEKHEVEEEKAKADLSLLLDQLKEIGAIEESMG